MVKIIKAGAEKTDISPSKGIELAGYPHYPRNNTGVHDPLYASCLFLDDGDEKVFIISLDLVFFSKKYLKEVRKRISDATGVAEHNITAACTHTHSGPWASGRLDIEALENEAEPDDAYVEELKDKIVKTAVSAFKETFTASIGTGSVHCGKESGIGGNRRDPEGISDPELAVLGIRDAEGIIRAIVVNYALHPTFLHADNTLVSSDYPGYIREYLEKRYPGSVMLFLEGCAGDQSSRYFRQGQSFDEAKRVGYAMGTAASGVLDDIEFKPFEKICVGYRELPFSLREFKDEKQAETDVEKARMEYDSLKKNGAGYIQLQNANVKLLGAEDMLGYIRMVKNKKRIALYEDEQPMEIQVIGIGRSRIAALPGEIFVSFGLEIKKANPEGTVFVSAVTNGCLPGYVYTKEALALGGYEVDTSMLCEDTGEKMTETVKDIFKEMEDIC